MISIIKAEDLPKMDIVSTKACDLNAYIASNWRD